MFGSCFRNFQGEKRTEKVFSVFGATSDDNGLLVTGLLVHGNIDKLDLRGVRFRDCVFENSVFSDCMADSGTKFEQCSFRQEFEVIGKDRESWKCVALVNSSVEGTARLVWDDLLGNSSSGDNELDEVVKLALSKFWRYGRLKRSIRKADWKKGLMGKITLGDEVLRAMLKIGLISEIEISGVSEGGYGMGMDVIGDVQQLMDNGQVSGIVLKLFKELRS